jgi:hypothetical protein
MMSDADPEVSSTLPPPRRRQPNIFDMILPPAAFPLLLMLWVMIPLTVLTGASLFVPLF